MRRHDPMCSDIAADIGRACACDLIDRIRDNLRQRRRHEPGYVLEIDRWFCVNCEKPWPCPVVDEVAADYRRGDG